MAQIFSLAEKQLAKLQPLEFEIEHSELPFWYEVHEYLAKVPLDQYQKEKRWEFEEFVSSFKMDLDMLGEFQKEVGEDELVFRFMFDAMNIFLLQQALNDMPDSHLKRVYGQLFAPKMNQKVIR